MKPTYFIISLAAIIAVTATAITSLTTITDKNTQDRFSSVGSGTVYAKADIANIQVGFRSGIKKTPAEATTEGANKMNNIITTLKKLGIDEKDIKTSGYYLNPSYNWTSTRGQELVGYEVSQNLTLKIRDLDKVSDVIAQTTEQGANQIGNITFTIDDEFELRNQARELAIQKAKEKAAIVSKQAGIKLGKLKGVYENTDMPIQTIAYSNVKRELAQDANEASAPMIEAGQNEIRAEVTLIYEVK